MTTATISDIQSRIAEIQQRMGMQGQPNDGILGSSSPNGSAFSDALSSALGTDSSNGLGSLASMFGGDVSGQSVVADAMQYLGVPYKWGGTNPATGLDCSGLVQRVYGDMGIQLPRLAADQARQGTPVASLAQAQPGDLVAFGSPVDHIGIYIGDNQMVVAPKTGDVVKVEKVYTTPTAIRHIIPDGASGAGATEPSYSSYLMNAALGMGAPSFGGQVAGGNINFGSLSSQFDSQFASAGAKYGISPTLLAAVAKQESGFNPLARSGAGAQGLMQFMPSTAAGLGVNPFDPASAIDGAARMLSGLQQRFGSTSLALAAYNAGAGAVQRYGGVPPYAETQNYVRNILAMQNGVSV